MDSNNRLCVKIIHCGNVSLINPQDREQKNMFFMPMGLFPLADALRRNEINVEIIHLDMEIDQSIKEVLDFSIVDAVGFDCHWLNQSLLVMETAELIKQVNPRIFIFLGGYTASLFAKEIISNFPQVDAVIRGDGEIPIVELCRVLQENKGTPPPGDNAFQKIKNLAWRQDFNTIQLNDISYVGTAEKMEKLDFAAVDLLRNWEYYRKVCVFFSHYQPFKSTPVFFLEVGRGCQYACLFCGGNCEAQKRISNREHTIMRSVDSIIETIKKAVSFGFKTFYSCLEFEGSEAWYIELFKRIKEEHLKINFCYGAWGLPSKALIDAISGSCEHGLFEVSPETSSHRLRKKNKDLRLFYTNEELEECLDYISKKNNMKVQLYFGYYLADDTRETIFNTARFAMEMLIKYPHCSEIEYSNFSTDPGSLFFFYPEKYDIEVKVRNLNDYIKNLKENYVIRKGQPADMTLFKPVNISRQEDAEIRRKMNLINFLFFSFRKSISYILDKTKSPDIIMESIEDTDIPLTADNKFPKEKTRDFLLDRCYKNDILDHALFQLITDESDNKKARSTKPTTQMYLDLEKVENIKTSREDYEAYLDANENKTKSVLVAQNKIQEEENFEF